MYPINPPAVFIHEGVLEDPRCVARMERMMACIHTAQAPQVVGDAELNEISARYNWPHELDGKRRTGSLNRCTDPVIVFNRFRWLDSEQMGALKQAYPHLSRFYLLGDGAITFSNGRATLQTHNGVCQDAYVLHSAWGCLHSCDYCNIGSLLNIMLDIEEFADRTLALTKRLPQTLYKYDDSSDSTSIVQAGLPGAPNGEIGSIAPTADGRYIYFMLAATREVWRLDTHLDTFVFFANTCGTNYWRIYNLSLSPDEQSLYFVSNNNNFSTIRRIDVATGNCSQVLDVNTLLGSRDLSFGGTGVWDDDGYFYAPVWSFGSSPPDPALLKVKVEVPEPSTRMLCVSGILLLVALAKRGRSRGPLGPLAEID